MIPIRERSCFLVPDPKEQSPRRYILTLTFANTGQHQMYLDSFAVKDGAFIGYQGIRRPEAVVAVPVRSSWSVFDRGVVTVMTREQATRQAKEDTEAMMALHEELAGPEVRGLTPQDVIAALQRQAGPPQQEPGPGQYL